MESTTVKPTVKHGIERYTTAGYHESEEECFGELKERFPSWEIDLTKPVSPDQFNTEKEYILVTKKESIDCGHGTHFYYSMKKVIYLYTNIKTDDNYYTFQHPEYVTMHLISIDHFAEKYILYELTEDSPCCK